MEVNFVIEILGSDWKVHVRDVEEEPRLEKCSGFTDWTVKEIVIGEVPADTTLGDPLEFQKKVLRHEIVHAFMFESGLLDAWEHTECGQDETIVDWIALQLPKLWVACVNAEARMMRMLRNGGKED